MAKTAKMRKRKIPRLFLLWIALFAVVVVVVLATTWLLNTHNFHGEEISQQRQVTITETSARSNNVLGSNPGLKFYASASLDSCEKGYSVTALEPKNYRFACSYSQTDYLGYNGSLEELAANLDNVLAQNGFKPAVYFDGTNLGFAEQISRNSSGQSLLSLNSKFQRTDQTSSSDYSVIYVIVGASQSDTDISIYDTPRYREIYRSEKTVDEPRVIQDIESENQYFIKLISDQHYYTEQTLLRRLFASE